MMIRWKCRDRILEIGGRPLVMGILNVTPDSFSDGGTYFDTDRAVERALEMAREGADIIDIGGESTRPGAESVAIEEEIARVVPVVERVAAETDAPVSVDTMKAGVARRAIGKGAVIINDVSACEHDADMIDLAAESGAGMIIMHMRGMPRTMQNDPRYEDVIAEIALYLERRADCLERGGVSADSIAVDPGIGFGKTAEHNLRLLAGLDRIRVDDRPVVVGLSRKSLLETLTGRKIEDRTAAGIGGNVFCALNGANVLRVHDVRETVDALATATAIAARR